MNDLIKRLRALSGIIDHVAMREAADRLTAMKAAGDGLAGFVRHVGGCRAGIWPNHGHPCDCGITAALKQWKEASDEL
jgi:hypothetical protein